jgi:hypothetical protein
VRGFFGAGGFLATGGFLAGAAFFAFGTATSPAPSTVNIKPATGSTTGASTTNGIGVVAGGSGILYGATALTSTSSWVAGFAPNRFLINDSIFLPIFLVWFRPKLLPYI